MIRNDFIMRLIELLGVFLAKVFRKIESGDFEGAQDEVDKTCKETLGIPVSILVSNQPENLIALFSTPTGVDYYRILTASVLLDAKGEIAAKEANESSAFIHWTKAAPLYLKAVESPDEEIQKRSTSGISEVEKKLIDFNIPQSLQIQLAEYHEQAGRYAFAENYFFDTSSKSMLAEFYDRILALPDNEIEAGDLTRAEVLESRAGLG